MAIKRYSLHCLLALCIGLLPVLNAGATSAVHAPDMPMDCAACGPLDRHHVDGCQDPGCTTMGQSCQANTAASYLPASSESAITAARQAVDAERSDAPGPQGLHESIYRPPIT